MTNLSTTGTGEPIPSAPPGTSCLVADSSPLVCRIAASLMSHMNCRVIEAPTGMIVLDWCSRTRFDFVLIDWDLPIMDGLTCLRLLRAASLDYWPIVAISSSADHPSRIRKAIDNGADDYIVKPYFVDSLWAAVSQSDCLRRAA